MADKAKKDAEQAAATLSEVTDKLASLVDDRLTANEVIYKMIDAGQLPEIKALTRRQRKELDAKGINPVKQSYEKGDYVTPITVSEAVADFVCDTVYPDFDFDDLPNNAVTVFCELVISRTYSNKLSEKN